MKKTNYWAVTAKCGHVGGASKYIPITFYIEAYSKKEASDKVISIPRVKHHNKQVILGIENISYDEYSIGVKINSRDPYLKCRNVQEQRYYLDEIYDRIIDETDNNERFYKKERKNIGMLRKNIDFNITNYKFDRDLYNCEFYTV